MAAPTPWFRSWRTSWTRSSDLARRRAVLATRRRRRRRCGRRTRGCRPASRRAASPRRTPGRRRLRSCRRAWLRRNGLRRPATGSQSSAATMPSRRPMKAPTSTLDPPARALRPHGHGRRDDARPRSMSWRASSARVVLSEVGRASRCSASVLRLRFVSATSFSTGLQLGGEDPRERVAAARREDEPAGAT